MVKNPKIRYWIRMPIQSLPNLAHCELVLHSRLFDTPATFNQAKCNGSRVVVESEITTRLKTILPSLPQAVIDQSQFKWLEQ